MKIGRIIHQQVVQLRWHFLACLGLVMVLPLEEAWINLKNGDGFYATALSLSLPVAIAPLLAGLIACANVQADMDDKRYVFWRSKPVGVKSFVGIKYLVGLLIAFVIIALPVAFTYISCGLVQDGRIERGFIGYIVNYQFITLLAYTLCFLCNSLVRKTARAWLIGMAITCFLLLVPFILPLNFKDITTDYLSATSVIYGPIASIALCASLVAFVISLFAVSRNWHLRTNLRGLLWTGAALFFLVMMFIAHQVANIKVLDEMEIQDDLAFTNSFHRTDDAVRLGRFEVDTSDRKIKLKDVDAEPPEELLEQQRNMPKLYEVEKGLSLRRYPRIYKTFYKVGNDIFFFNLCTYYHEEKVGTSHENHYRNIYLRSYKQVEGVHRLAVSALDLSDIYQEEYLPKVAMRQIEDKLVVFVSDSCAVIKINDDGGLELI
ncbi:MAG: hypothetical protein ACYTFK_01070, partial [Planctomycetota bacterium]